MRAGFSEIRLSARFWGIPSVENDTRLGLETKIDCESFGTGWLFLNQISFFYCGCNRWRSHVGCKVLEALHAKREPGLRSTRFVDRSCYCKFCCDFAFSREGRKAFIVK